MFSGLLISAYSGLKWLAPYYLFKSSPLPLPHSTPVALTSLFFRHIGQAPTSSFGSCFFFVWNHFPPGMHLTDFFPQSVLRSTFSVKSALRTYPSQACHTTSRSLPHSLSPCAAAFPFLIAFLPSVLTCYVCYCLSPPPRIDASWGQESSFAMF